MPTAGVERESVLRPAPVAVPKSTRTLRVALIGNPNTGKTTLFNRLCGTRAKTSNFPGTTTSAKVGRAVVGGDVAVDIVDLPGLYRLSLDLPEARIARDVLAGSGPYAQPDAVVVVVDACNLTRNLILTGELLAYGLPVVIALNMVDLAQQRGLSLDPAKLSAHLGSPVVAVVARRGLGLEGIRASLGNVLQQRARRTADAVPAAPADARDLTAWAEHIVEDSVGGASAVGSGADTLTERLDKTFTHPVLGLLLFAGVMVGLFYTLFALATLPMDLIEATFAQLGEIAGRFFWQCLVLYMVL